VYAGEALHCANVAGDSWEIAEASRGKAIASSSSADLRERVDTAALMLTEVGNVRQLAALLTSASYAALCLGSERDAADFAARTIPVARALDSRFTWMIHTGNRGLAALLTGETEEAAHAFLEQLTLCHDMVFPGVAFEPLRGLAALAVLSGDDERAATLVGAAEAHRNARPLDPVETRLDQTFFEPARTRYGSAGWDAAARQGSALSFERAVACALDEAARRKARRTRLRYCDSHQCESPEDRKGGLPRDERVGRRGICDRAADDAFGGELSAEVVAEGHEDLRGAGVQKNGERAA